MLTIETPAPGLHVHQPKQGYRYSVDIFLAVGFALENGVPKTALDLGTGCGIGAFLLASLGVEARGVDRMTQWSPLWQASLEHSSVSPHLQVESVKRVEGAYECVVCNPPYWPVGRGPVSSHPLRAAAHTELDGTLADFVTAAARCLEPDGRAVFVLPTERTAELDSLLPGLGVAPSRRLHVGHRLTLSEFGFTSPVLDTQSCPPRGARVDQLVARARGR